MAGLGDSGKGVARRKRRDGLATDVASQLEAEAAGGARPADSPHTSSVVPALKKTSTKKEKGSWYVTVELADALRDACEFLNAQGYELNGSRVSVGALIEPPILQFLQTLYDEHNDGEPFPVSLATKTSRARRRRR